MTLWCELLGFKPLASIYPCEYKSWIDNIPLYSALTSDINQCWRIWDKNNTVRSS